jgi:hypothetical protein
VTLDDLTTPPYRGVVEFDQVTYGFGTHQETRPCDIHRTDTAFMLKDRVPNAVIR